MRRFRENTIFKVFWFITALHTFNFSVDTPDPQPTSDSCDVSYNDLDSLVEIILEQYMGIGDTIPDKDTPDHDKTTKITVKMGVDYYFHQLYTTSTKEYLVNYLYKPTGYSEPYSSQFLRGIDPPPPKA